MEATLPAKVDRHLKQSDRKDTKEKSTRRGPCKWAQLLESMRNDGKCLAPIFPFLHCKSFILFSSLW